MAIEATGVENVMEEVAHFWQLRKFQFIEEATDFWMDAVAPKECLGDEDPNLRTALTLNQFFTEWLLFEMPYQESTLVGITALRDEISAESRDVLKQIAETQRFSSFKMQWLNPDTSMVQLRDVYSGKCYIVESAHLADGTVVYEDAEADDARVEVVDQYVVIRETYEFPIAGEWTRNRREFSKCEIRIHVPAGSIAQGEYDIS